MFFLRNQKRNNKQPLSNFEAEIAVEAKQLEAQPKKVVAYKNKPAQLRKFCDATNPCLFVFAKKKLKKK